MDPPKVCRRANPLKQANFLSKLTFWYVESLFGLSKTHRINHEDLYRAPVTEETAHAGDVLQRSWDKEADRQKSGQAASFLRALVRAFGLHYAAAGILVLIEPILFQYLIEYFDEDSPISKQTALLLAGGIALAGVVQALVGTQVVIWFIRAGMRWQAGATSIIYKKAIKLSQPMLGEVTTGHIVDLISSDVEKLDFIIWFAHVIWQAPLHTVVCMYLLYQQLGWTALTGLGVAIVLLPLQMLIAKIIAHYTEKYYGKMDERVGMMGEIIGGMRVIKMYCWEKPFGKVIDAVRKTELRYLWRTRAYSSILVETDTFTSHLLIVVIVTVYVATQDGGISAAKVFPSFAIINLLCQTLLNALPWGIKTYLEVAVSWKRIQEFLLQPEMDDGRDAGDLPQDHGEPCVEVTALSASWDTEGRDGIEADVADVDERTPLLGNCHGTKDSKPPLVLDNISFDLHGNKLMAILGPVGSSKTSLLMALLGELKLSSGSVKIRGTLAYSSQNPWVFSSTIRQNILFGREYDADWYTLVLEATALVKDLSLLPHGDLSLVGEKGVTLSGGQKARVALARAVYARSDIILLDDPLSAVDANVGKHIFDKCINGLLKKKMRILVTHQSQYVKDLENILVLKKGKMEAFGNFSSLVESGLDLEHLEDSTEENNGNDTQMKREVELIPDEEKDTETLRKQLSICEEEVQEDEDRAVGSVSWRVYWDFFSAGAPSIVLLMVGIMCLLSQGAYNVSDWWLSIWTVAEEAGNTTAINDTLPFPGELGTYTNGGVYIGLTGASLVLGLARTLSFHRLLLHASRALHDRMYRAVIRSPVRFYDTNPKGRIINRFSGDTNSMDTTVPDLILEFVQYAMMVLGNLVLIVIMNPWTLIPTIPLVIALILIRLRYIRVQREVERCLSEAHSPALTHLNATLEGVQTIRAFQKEEECIRDFHAHYDVFMGCWFINLALFCWFQVRNNLTAALFNTAAVFILTLMAEGTNAGQAGLTLSYIMPMMWYVETTTRLSADMEIQMVKTERVLRYTTLPPESALDSHHPPPPSWPEEGSITFKHVHYKYHQTGPAVLKDVNLEIQPGSKIGVVGRTGAGKSSLIQALFRMSEPEGEISIDSRDICGLGLHELRSKLSIIPQDPVLFKGSIRFNLDPFEEHNDADIWAVLEEIQLKTLVSEKTEGLQAEVSEGGGNFSVGEKQLFCLGRAILRNNRILLIDEATANVDKRTDELIQQSIRKKFATCTVITIAHRIGTVLDSNKILVLHEGRVIEYDTPGNLINNPSSHLYKMINTRH